MTGLDTETDRGRAVLIATPRLYKEFPESFSDCLDFLLTVGDEEFICWNADYDISAMLKFLPDSLLERIYQFGQWQFRMRLSSWSTEGLVRVEFRPGKFFRVLAGDRKLAIYDLAQFYNKMKLGTAARKFIGEEKKDPGVDWKDLKAVLSGDPRFPKEKRDQLIEYCMHDARLVEMLLEDSRKKFENIGISFQEPVSCASLSARVFRDEMDFSALLPEYNEMAQRSFRGGMIECLRAGYFERAWYIDLRSAYPAAICNLPEMPKSWRTVEKKPESGATYACIECAVTIPHQLMKGPLPFWQHGGLIYPVGRWRTWLDLYSFRNAENLGLIERVYGGIQGFGTVEKFPFREKIHRLYLERMVDEQKKFAVKIILNSLYGKFAETNDGRLTSHTNFFMAAEITSRTRWRLLKDIDPADVIFYATDGVFLKRKPEGLAFGANLGQWSEPEEVRDLVVVGSGVYTYRRSDGSVETKFRGFSSGLDLYALLDTPSYVVPVSLQRNQKLGITVRNGRWDAFNVIRTDERELNVNFDKKRKWERSWTAKDLLRRSFESAPWQVNEIDQASFVFDRTTYRIVDLVGQKI
jgi:hypothetical protein